MAKTRFSVEVDKYDATALTHSLNALEEGIPDFAWGWRIFANGGGIDYGIFLNFNINEKEIEICNQPRDGEGNDMLEDVFDALGNEEEDEDNDEV